MAGHVHDVPGARHQRGQSIGVGLGALRAIGGFDQMDVEVDRPWVVGTFRKNAFQPFLDIGRPALRFLAARLPIVPGLGVHRRLGRQYRQFEVVGILVRQRRGCICEGGVERRPFGSRIIGISRGDRLRSGPFSLSLAPAASSCAFRSAAIAGAFASGSIGTLMFGPSTSRLSRESTSRKSDRGAVPCGKPVALPRG